MSQRLTQADFAAGLMAIAPLLGWRLDAAAIDVLWVHIRRETVGPPVELEAEIFDVACMDLVDAAPKRPRPAEVRSFYQAALKNRRQAQPPPALPPVPTRDVADGPAQITRMLRLMRANEWPPQNCSHQCPGMMSPSCRCWRAMWDAPLTQRDRDATPTPEAALGSAVSALGGIPNQPSSRQPAISKS